MSGAAAAALGAPPFPPSVGPRDVIDAACRLAGIPAAKLLGPGRKVAAAKAGIQRLKPANLVRLRAACAWIMRERLAMSLPEIGAHLGYGDHTTVLHHLRNSCTTTPTRDAAVGIEAEVRRAAAEKEPKGA